jgi:hypothetical protein
MKIDKVLPLLRRLLVDLEHPAKRRVARGADLRHDRTPLFNLCLVCTLRRDRGGCG